MNDLTLAICMYNAERYIEETLAAIMVQTMQDFQLLIVNDCSTDSSVALVEKFFCTHPRQYELISFEENRGLCAGRCFVEEYATTKYLLFVDSDDIPLPSLVEKLYNKISSDNDLMAVGCHQSFIDGKSKPLNGGIYLGETNKEAFIAKAAKAKLIFMQPTAIYDREIALSVGGHNIVGFPEGKPRYQDYCEDLDLWTRMSDLYTMGKAIVVVPEILCLYRKHERGLSSNSVNMLLRMRHIKKNLLLRRSGKSEKTFIEFQQSLTPEDMHSLERDARAADHLRTAYYTFRHGRIFSSLRHLAISIYNRPTYIIAKIRHNLLKMK